MEVLEVISDTILSCRTPEDEISPTKSAMDFYFVGKFRNNTEYELEIMEKREKYEEVYLDHINPGTLLFKILNPRIP